MQIKKSAIKTLVEKHSQLFWFVGLYLASLIGFSLFHWASQLFIDVIK